MEALSLVEFGRPTEWIWGRELLDALRTESTHWKQELGLSSQPFDIEYRGQRRYAVRAQGVAGFLRLGDLSVEIRPKFLSGSSSDNWRRALWQILAAVEERPTLGVISRAAPVNEESLADLLGWVLLDSLRKGGLEGLPRGYTEAEGSLPVLRGRLDTSKVLDLLTQPYKLPCVYDVYTEDIPVNRLFRWAALTLAPAVRSPALSRMLSDEAVSLRDVSSVAPGIIEAEYLSLPVQYQHLLPALQVSRLLLRRQSLQHDMGELQVPSFLWNTADIFERFVRHLLIQVCDYNSPWQLDKPTLPLAHLMNDPSARKLPISTVPDYRIRASGRTVLILDAKYKIWSRQPRVDDVYQVMAGGRLNSCDKVGLVYPCPTHDRKLPLTWRIQGDCNPSSLTCIFVDLLRMGEATGELDLVRTLNADIVGVV